MTYRHLEHWPLLGGTDSVVVLHKNQHLSWTKHKAILQGWKAVGKEGLKLESGILGPHCNFPRII